MFVLVTSLVCLAIAGHVQSYPHYKSMAGIQAVETALIMRYLEDELAEVQANECNPAYAKMDNVITTENLEAMTNVFTHKTNTIRTHLYVPAAAAGNFRREFLVRSNGANPGVNHAEDRMYAQFRGHLPLDFWLTNSPCPGCARNLMARYSDAAYVLKPNIHVIHFYTIPPNGPAQYTKAIECMAKMMHDGFTFLLWDWAKFSNQFLVTPICKKIVSEITTKYVDNLQAELADTTAAIIKAGILADQVGYREGQIHPDKLCKP